MTRYVVVTGTDTGVGKTVVTAALAATLFTCGAGRVAVVKPVQTGVGRGEADAGDVDVVRRLAGGHVAVHELVRLRAALAPEAAARAEGVTLPPVGLAIDRIRALEADVVLVEGAGGVLVRLDHEKGTVVDLALALDAEVVVVTRDALGTLNHTCLTVEHVRCRGLVPRLVLGSRAARPDRAARSNLTELTRVTGLPLVGAVPEGAGRLDATTFGRLAPTWWTAPGWPLPASGQAGGAGGAG